MSKAMVQEKKIGNIAHRQVVAALREILNDPDRGLMLKPSFVSRINKSMRSKETGRVTNLKAVLAKYGAV